MSEKPLAATVTSYLLATAIYVAALLSLACVEGPTPEPTPTPLVVTPVSVSTPRAIESSSDKPCGIPFDRLTHRYELSWFPQDEPGDTDRRRLYSFLAPTETPEALLFEFACVEFHRDAWSINVHGGSWVFKPYENLRIYKSSVEYSRGEPAEKAPWSRTLRIVMDEENGYCQMCRTRISVNERPLSDAERELGWPSIFVVVEKDAAGAQTRSPG